MNKSFNPQWARRAQRPGEAPFGMGHPPFSMAYGVPDPSLFPYAELAAATARLMQDPAYSAMSLQYGRSQGQPQLINLLVDKFLDNEGLSIEPDNIVITNGSSGAIGLAARALVDEGDTVLVEAPSFVGAMSILSRTGAELQAVPIGESGIDVAGTEAVLHALHVRGIRPRVLYTMPTFHNPTGLTLPEAQRYALLNLARRFNLIIIEDDAYRDLYYDATNGPLPPSLYAMDREGRVIRTGTFSKILAPGMRLGWALAQPEVVHRMMLLKEEGGSTPFTQHLLVEYAKDGALTAHIESIVETYRKKRDATMNALQRHFPPDITWTRPAGGFYTWITLPSHVDAALLAALASEQGVDYMLGEECFFERPAPGNHLRLSFSMLDVGSIDEAVKRLGRALNSLP